MTINKYLQQISPEDLAYVKRYHHEIQPFRVLPSSTLEFDGQFNGVVKPFSQRLISTRIIPLMICSAPAVLVACASIWLP